MELAPPFSIDSHRLQSQMNRSRSADACNVIRFKRGPINFLIRYYAVIHEIEEIKDWREGECLQGLADCFADLKCLRRD